MVKKAPISVDVITCSERASAIANPMMLSENPCGINDPFERNNTFPQERTPSTKANIIKMENYFDKTRNTSLKEISLSANALTTTVAN